VLLNFYLPCTQKFYCYVLNAGPDPRFEAFTEVKIQVRGLLSCDAVQCAGRIRTLTLLAPSADKT